MEDPISLVLNFKILQSKYIYENNNNYNKKQYEIKYKKNYEDLPRDQTIIF